MSEARSIQTDNPHLLGNNRAVYEEITAEDLHVAGEIPSDIRGNFLRVGPNPYFVPDEMRCHLFDGDGAAWVPGE